RAHVTNDLMAQSDLLFAKCSGFNSVGIASSLYIDSCREQYSHAIETATSRRNSGSKSCAKISVMRSSPDILDPSGMQLLKSNRTIDPKSQVSFWRPHRFAAAALEPIPVGCAAR